ncbi:MAG: hypothetical protein B6242_14835 [Anaerolineaceae bacterium 4572_78]|nr:MAG: hypothetical protein B6242_14835 [Anaerolineaceae bacterium 4572_78]
MNILNQSSKFDFLDNLNIGRKLGLAFSLLIMLSIIFGVMLFVMENLVKTMFEEVHNADKVASLARQIEVELLEMRRNEKNFLLRYSGQSFEGAYGNYVLPNQQHFQTLLDLLTEIRSIIPAETEREVRYASFLDKLETATHDYQTVFNNLVENIRIRGDQNYGLTGDVLEMLDTLDKEIDETNESDIKITSSNLRKAYLSYLHFGFQSTGYNYTEQPVQKHIDNFREGTKQLQTLIKSHNNLSASKRENLSIITKEIQSMFEQLLMLDNEIIEHEKQLAMNARSITTLAGRIISNEEERQTETFAEFITLQNRYVIAGIVLFITTILSSVILAVIFTRSIAMPITHLTAIATQIAQAPTLDAWTGKFDLTRQDEIGMLAKDFNYMTIRLQTLIADLQEREQKYRTIFEESKDVLFVTTAEGQLIEVNPACKEIFGYTIEEAKLLNVVSFYAFPEDRQRFRNAVESEGFVKNLNLKMRRRDDKIIDCLVSATLHYDPSGNFMGYQGIIHDMTAQKHVETERLKLTAIRRELSIAKNIQHNLLPPNKPNWHGVEVVCFTQSAQEIGGDLYAYHAFPPTLDPMTGEVIGGRYGIAVGDVSGKGISAALLMALTMSTFKSTVQQFLEPPDLLAQMDKTLMTYTKKSRQNCAFVYVEFDIDLTGIRRGTMVNAGCSMPLIRRHDGTVDEIEIGGMPLGVGLGSQSGYMSTEVELQRDDMVILMSDGLPEAMNEHNEMFGFERLMYAVKSFSNQDLKGFQNISGLMLEHIKDKVMAFIGDAEPHDDLTIVVVQV